MAAHWAAFLSARRMRAAPWSSSSASADVNGQGPAGGAPTADEVLTIEATSEGDWGNDVYVMVVKPDQDSLAFDLLVGHRKDGEFVEDESFNGLTMVADDDNYALTQVNGNSSYVQLTLGPAAEIGGSRKGVRHAHCY